MTETEIVTVRWDGKKAEFSLPRNESEETEEEEEISERFYGKRVKVFVSSADK